MPNVPLLTVNAALIDDTGAPSTLCDGQSAVSQVLNISGGNGVLKYGTNLYACVSDSSGHMRIYRSDLTGAVWAAFGASTAMTAHGGGMCAVLSGSTIVTGYAGPTQTNDGYFRTFNILTGTWGVEGHFDTNVLSGGAIDFWQGPYYIFVRPDNSIVFVGDQSAAPNTTVAIVIVAGVATTAVAFPQGGNPAQVLAALMDTDGTIHVIAESRSGGFMLGQHQVFHTNNVADAEVTMNGLPTLLDWNGDGIEQGLLDGVTFYFAAGKKTVDYPTIWGRPVIVYGNDGAWNITPLLDTALDADLSVYDGNLFLHNGFFVAVFRYIDSVGDNTLLHRWGYVAKADFADPTKWVWATAYNLAVPNPLIDGAGPYNIVDFKGMNTGVVFGSDNVIRFATTVSGVKQFVALLFSISFPSSSTPTHFPYIDINGVPSIPINFRVASPSGMIWRQVCDPDEHPKKEETKCSQ